MKHIILFLMMSLCSYSQEISEEEYEIYANVIGDQCYQVNPINFGFNKEDSLSLNFLFKTDSIANKIAHLPKREVDYYKIIEKAWKYFNYKRCRKPRFRLIFSPIYFENKNNAYIIIIKKHYNTLKDFISFYNVKKINNEWCIERYMFIF